STVAGRGLCRGVQLSGCAGRSGKDSCPDVGGPYAGTARTSRRGLCNSRSGAGDYPLKTSVWFGWSIWSVLSFNSKRFDLSEYQGPDRSNQPDRPLLSYYSWIARERVCK